MIFDDMYGQARVKRVLTDMVANSSVGHAFVFNGAEGIGRRYAARRFAALLMCRNRAEGELDICHECVSCRLSESDNNPDLVYVRPEDGRSTLGVETIRNIQDSMSLAPEYGLKKVYIIEQAEKMTVQAQNALLKTIEEPPAYVVVIMICANASMLIETVRSRVVQLDFARNSDDEVLRAYKERCGDIPQEDVPLVLAYADGIIGRAVSFSDFDLFRQLRNKAVECLGLLTREGADFMLAVGELFDKNSEHKEFLFFTFISIMRDMMIVSKGLDSRNASESLGVASSRLQNIQFRDTIERLSGDIGYHRVAACIAVVNEAAACCSRNVNYKLTVDSMAIKLREAVL